MFIEHIKHFCKSQTISKTKQYSNKNVNLKYLYRN